MNMIPVLVVGCVLLPLLAAPVVYWVQRKEEKIGYTLTSLICLAVLLAAAFLLTAKDFLFAIPDVFLLGCSFAGGGLRSVFALLCAFMFFMSSLANPAYFKGSHRVERYSAFLLVTLGSTMGVFFAGDLFTLYICFEAMSLGSWVWVAHNEDKLSKKASDTYLAMAMIGGLVMLYGLFVLFRMFGTLDLSQMPALAMAYPDKKALLLPAVCMLVGFGVKAGMFPLHVWLPNTYLAAPAPATALLSSILSKTGVFGILLIIVCLMWGDSTFMMLMIVLGCITMVLGAVLALFSTNLKRTLACSSMSQIGFILVGTAMMTAGEETALAAGGVMAHSINHALAKLILFLCAGVIFKHFNTLDLNELKGAGRNNLPMKLCFLVGGVSLAGVPGFGGYISKTLLHEGIVEQMHLQSGMMQGILSGVEWAFLISGGLTLAYMTKLFVKIFVEKPDQKKTLTMDRGTLFAIVPMALALVVMGILPSLTYEKIGAYAAASMRSESFAVSYFVWENLKGSLISLAIGALVYLLIVRGLMTDHRDGSYRYPVALLELENDVYRPLLNGLAFVGAFAARLVYSITDVIAGLMNRLLHLHASQRVTPGEDHHFGHYSKRYVKMNALLQTLQFELMLFGIGVVVTLVYLLIRL